MLGDAELGESELGESELGESELGKPELGESENELGESNAALGENEGENGEIETDVGAESAADVLAVGEHAAYSLAVGKSGTGVCGLNGELLGDGAAGRGKRLILPSSTPH